MTDKQGEQAMLNAPIKATDRYTIRWYDDARTILLVHVQKPWKWEDAHEGIGVVNDTIRATAHNVYTVYYFEKQVPMVPKGPAFANLRSIMAVDLPNEQLLIFVGGSMILKRFIDIVGKVYGIGQAVSKFKFVSTLDEAAALIAAHKAEKQPTGSPSTPAGP